MPVRTFPKRYRTPPVAYGEEYRATRVACGPFVASCPESWRPFTDNLLPTREGREIRTSFTQYGGLRVLVNATPEVDRILEMYRKERLAVQREADAFKEKAAEMGVSLKGRTIGFPLPGAPPTLAQRPYLPVSQGGKTAMELYHAELPGPEPYEPIQGFAIPERGPRPLGPGRTPWIEFTIPPRSLQEFCRWVRSSFSDKTPARDVVNWAATSIRRYGRVEWPAPMRVPSLLALETLHPVVSWPTVAALSWQVFGQSALDRLTPTRFAQVMEELNWVPERIVGGRLNLWFPTAQAAMLLPPSTRALRTTLTQF